MADTTTVAEAATEKNLTVDQAMIKVMQEIGPVGKNGRNIHQNYEFRANEDIVAAVRGPMAKYGLRMLPEVTDQKHFVRGERTNVAILTVRYRIRGPLGDEIEPPIVVVGEAQDLSDKASNKAMTAAKKYAYLQAFEIADGADDGDNDHLVASGSPTDRPAKQGNPLDWYIEQIKKKEVWYSEQALRGLLNRAQAAGVDNLHMPDRSGHTFFQVVDAQGAKLHAEQTARARQQAEDKEAARRQMSAEFPDPPDPYDDEWSQTTPGQSAPAQAPQRPAPTPPAPSAPTPPAAPAQPAPQWQPPALPDSAEVESAFAAAMADPANCWQSLLDMRQQYGTVALVQTTIRTDPWGEVDANSAITMALTTSATPSQPPTSPPTPSPTPAAWPEPTPIPEPPQAPPQPTEEAPALPPLRLAPHTAGMRAEERAQANLRAEAELQAQMLGMDTLEYVADLLPEGGSSIDDVAGGSRLMDLIASHRPKVVAAFIERGMPSAAEAYAKFGNRVPARDINKFLKDVLGVGVS
ncbi:ERF family protein [Streptomyces sp. BV286]|uniref:ERF family protein n=1 Tax=Streptomyces sp. BV286 TaxID=2849672 RepID=UPI001C2DF957|nr:ERF family protein [Streptomyces sp. BV286]MBV1940781.1 ERF family protein [Streptomyces sp. BV286]